MSDGGFGASGEDTLGLHGPAKRSNELQCRT